MVAQSSSQPKVSDTPTYRDNGHPCSQDLSRPWRRATELTLTSRGDVPVGLAEEVSQKRGLSGLTRSGENHGGELGCCSCQYRFQRTLEVVCIRRLNLVEIVHS